MALQDTITNLGTAIINLVTSKITTHDAEIEETLLELKAKVDELVENSGSGEEESPISGVNPNAFDYYDKGNGRSYIFWVNSTFTGTQEELQNIYINGEPSAMAPEPTFEFGNGTLVSSYYASNVSSVNYKVGEVVIYVPDVDYSVKDNKVYMTDGKTTYWRHGISTTPELDAYNETLTETSDK